jgi:hypothetical protein
MVVMDESERASTGGWGILGWTEAGEGVEVASAAPSTMAI